MNRSQMQLIGISGAFLTILLIVILTFVFRPQTPAPQSSFVLSPTQAPSPTEYIEPVVLNWDTYTNDTYQFSIDYPLDWKKQEYKSLGDQGGITVAFSPQELPCATCDYVREGYYSVKVYNHTSAPLLYDEYQNILKNSQNSKSDRKVVIDGTESILHETSIYLEHNGFVYEISFDEMGNATSVDSSKIFVRAATSFKFTSLRFIK